MTEQSANLHGETQEQLLSAAAFCERAASVTIAPLSLTPRSGAPGTC